MTEREALNLAYDETWSAGSEYPIPSFDDVMSFANKLEAIKEALAQQALDRKAENARELGLDYEPKQEPCGGCGGSGWVSRDPDIGTDQECFVCGGAGVIKPEQEPVAYGMWDTMLGYGGRMMMVRLDKGQDGCTVPLYTAPAHQNVNVDDIGVPVGVGGWLTTTSSQPEQEPVAFLANGIRFKISYDSRQSGGQIHSIPPELGGRWVALVAADDDCHLKLTTPPQRKPLTDEEIGAILEGVNAYGTRLYTFARAIEAAHGIKGEA